MPDPLSNRAEHLAMSSIFRCLSDIRDITQMHRDKYRRRTYHLGMLGRSHEEVNPTKHADHVISNIERHVQIVHVRSELKDFENQYGETMEHLQGIDE